ncbi:hypothetical protein ACJRO7_011293 [Eucalyptus globulus]|uniref:S-protein homolog n=1 Tax=Eucalyptus globulus TaxID=34317 RepID=A0ABD3LFK8_EUCGL
MHVVIQNNLPVGTTLTVHCKSKDDDLGFISIPIRWEFVFKPNIFGGTLFFCSFEWPGQFQRFDIYDEDRDVGYCKHRCLWKIFPNGPCRHGDVGQEADDCFPWNPPIQLGRKPLI